MKYLVYYFNKITEVYEQTLVERNDLQGLVSNGLIEIMNVSIVESFVDYSELLEVLNNANTKIELGNIKEESND